LIRELSVEDDGDGMTYLKIEPLHAPNVVFETGQTDPTPSSSPVPTPSRFEAKGLIYRFMAFDPEAPTLISDIKEWQAKLRLKYQLHDRGDHYEIEFLVLPKANGISIHYTTDGSSPTTTGSYATYNGKFKVPESSRVVSAVALHPAFNLHSEPIRIAIPQRGEINRPQIDLQAPARWTQQTKIDESGAVWDFIQRFEIPNDLRAFDISLTAESADGHQIVEYSGALDQGYDAPSLKAVADQLQAIVDGGSIRMTIGSIGFATGQSLLDWLNATNQPFNVAKVSQ
jgi:hypothetical protein